MIHSRVFGSVCSQFEDAAGRADLPFRYGGFPRHVLLDTKTWRGLDMSKFAHIFPHWEIPLIGGIYEPRRNPRRFAAQAM